MRFGGTLLYYLAAWALYLCALPFLLILSRKSKYKRAIPSRFFLKSNPAFEQSGLWFHACSLGEARSLAPLIDRFGKETPIDVSVITQTGFEEANKLGVPVRFLPFEIFLPFWLRRHRALIVLEAELWYLLFLLMKRKGAKTILLNARMSDRSYDRYRKMRWFYKALFSHVDKVYAQSQTDRNRLMELGAKDVEVIGNIKMFQKVSYTKKYTKPDALVITAASTHETEEELITDAWLEYGKGKLIVVPRHPERFDKVAKLLEKKAASNHKRFHRFSEREDFDSDIILVDRMGELNEIYAVTDVAVLGGAFAKIGGHNPLEPEFFGCKIISGKEIFNQKAIFSGLENVIFCENEGIGQALLEAETTPPAKILHQVDMDHVFEKIRTYVL